MLTWRGPSSTAVFSAVFTGVFTVVFTVVFPTARASAQRQRAAESPTVFFTVILRFLRSFCGFL
jgi:hypothetical protein